MSFEKRFAALHSWLDRNCLMHAHLTRRIGVISGKRSCNFTFVAVDVLIGACIAVALGSKAKDIGDFAFDNFGHLVQSGVMRRRTEWILSHHAPLGFKLNHEVDALLGSMALIVVDIWHEITAAVAPHAPVFVQFVCAVSALGGGATFFLCFAFDFLRTATAHVRISYILFSSIYRGLLRLLGTCGCWCGASNVTLSVEQWSASVTPLRKCC